MVSSAVAQLKLVRGVLRVAWFVLGACLLGWLFVRNAPASGILTASARIAQPSGFIDGFTPLDRARPVEEDGLWYSDIVAEPVYFHVAAPRLYDAVTVRMRYKNEGQPYLALGARADLDAWSFDLKPIDLPMLDGFGWAARQDGDFRVYERKATTRSAKEILEAPSGRVAVVAVDPVRWGLRLAKAAEQPFEAAVAYAGNRQIYVYVQEGPLDVSLGFRGPGDARIALVRQGRALLTRTRQGDGAVDLALTGAAPGLYRIDVAAPETMTLVGIRSAHGRVAVVSDGPERLQFPPGATAFEPEYAVFTWETDLAKAPYDAVVARYRPPETDAEGWRVSEATFDLRAAAASQGRVQMIVSAPDIREHGAKIRVDRVDVRYERPPFDAKALLGLFRLDL